MVGMPAAVAVAAIRDLGFTAEVVTIDGRDYLCSVGGGVSIVLSETGAVHTVQFHAEGHEGYAGFPFALPAHLSFSTSRTQARRLLGEPSLSGEAGTLPFLGPKPAWDVFAVDDLRVHVEYDAVERGIQLVSCSASIWT